MSALLIALVKVTKDDWVPGYAAAVHDIAARHGGRYLSRSAKIATVEGDNSDLTAIAVIQFPDTGAAERSCATPPTRRTPMRGRRAASAASGSSTRLGRARLDPLPSEGVIQ